MKRHAALFAIALLAGSALAHDSWIVDDGADLSIATGSRWPQVELVTPPDSIVNAGCSNARGDPLPFRAQPRAIACWAELREFDIELPPALVEVYMRDVRPPGAVRARWQALHADGVPWRERYRKFMRIENAPPGCAPDVLRAIRRPLGLDMEIVPVGDAPLRAGNAARFAVLSQGKPVPGLAVELVGARASTGVWSRSGDDGQVQWTLPFAGRWLVRAIALEADGDSAWRSRFVTLAFEAG